MNRCRWLGILLVVAALANPAGAGWLFKKHPKPNPAERVPTLIAILKTDPDAKKRANAAEELREFDAAAFPDIAPALIQAAQQDSSSSVRLEAIQSLGKLRPVSQQAGAAIEQAMANDGSPRNRLQARTTLWHYHLSGYHSAKSEEVAAPVKGRPTDEPPLAAPLGSNPARPASNTGNLPGPVVPVDEAVSPPPLPGPGGYQSLPKGPAVPPGGDGPDLNIPK